MEESHNTHIITYSSISNHSYKFDKDGNIVVDNIEDLIYDKRIDGDYFDKKKKNKEKFILHFQMINPQSKQNDNNEIYNLKNINKIKQKNVKNKFFENEIKNSEEKDEEIKNEKKEKKKNKKMK